MRCPQAIRYVPSEADSDIGTLEISLNTLDSISPEIGISRIDGNHRLYYADGLTKGYAPIQRTVSFCIAPNLTREQEITLFRDINDNQRRMNTSHLDNIEVRLTPEEQLKRLNPALYIAKELGHDRDSPLYDRVYEGGVKPGGFYVPLRTLHIGIKFMLSRPTKLTALVDVDAQYRVIRSYFHAVKKWQPQAWAEPRRYLILRGAGLWGICFIGADVIDRALARGKHGMDDMLEILRSGREWDWSNKGEFQGLSGRGGALKIRDRVAAEFQDDSGVSLSELRRRIMADLGQ